MLEQEHPGDDLELEGEGRMIEDLKYFVVHYWRVLTIGHYK
jgi:hypothetical protein